MGGLIKMILEVFGLGVILYNQFNLKIKVAETIYDIPFSKNKTNPNSF